MPTTTPTESPDPPTAPPPLPAVVADDLVCVRCGYSLRTLEVSSACPECGTPIATTLEAAVPLSRPRWLKGLVSGTAWLAIAIITAPLAPVLAIIYLVNYWQWGSSLAAPTIGVALGALAAFAFWTIGALKLATPEPRDREPPAELPVRQLLALSPVLGLALTIAAFALLSSTRAGRSEATIAAWIVLLPWGNLMVLAARVRGLFRQLSAPDLARRAGGLMGLLWASLAVLGLAWVLFVTGTDAQGQWPASSHPLFHWEVVFLCLCLGGLLALMVAGVRSLRLLAALRRQARTVLWAATLT